MGAVRGRIGGFALVAVAGCSFSGTGLTVEVSSVGTEDTGAGTGTSGEEGTGDTPTTGNGSLDPDTTNGPTQPPTTDPETTATPDDTTNQGSATSGTDAGESTAEDTGETSKGETMEPCEEKEWFLDADGDGYGVKVDVMMACAQPDGYAEKGDDCDDGDEEVSPGVVEVCDNKDNDCDGLEDEYSAMNESCGGCTIVPDDPMMPEKAYYFCTGPLMWASAKSVCEDKAAALVSDEEMAEHDFINGTLDVVAPNSGSWWIGGYRAGNLDTMYTWLSGPKIASGDMRWVFGEGVALADRCVMLASPGEMNGGLWSAIVCSGKLPYICEQSLLP